MKYRVYLSILFMLFSILSVFILFAFFDHNHRVRIKLARHGMRGFPVGNGVKDDRKIIVRRVKLRGRNKQLQPVVTHGYFLPLQLDDAVRPEVEGEEVKTILLK